MLTAKPRLCGLKAEISELQNKAIFVAFSFADSGPGKLRSAEAVY